MTRTRDEHRPLVSGIHVKSGIYEIRRGVHAVWSVGAGTLTGLATRNSDGKKVLVTNLHVMAGRSDSGGYQNPSGDEEMYQGLLNPPDKVGSNLVWEPLSFTEDNVVDVAMCELEDDVAAEFAMHDDQHNDPEYPNHSFRKIIAGVKEPTKNMELTLLGGRTGERTATVTDINVPSPWIPARGPE